ncbi:LIM domain-binding protein 3-like isoform X2 [Homarus americanus]|uniref:LIM domain-binding protein 3-like isoform X2 n=1 Tax=Homarus americanus TaxID=6706 RepID=UPI001C49486C|nr:LIM domain-binding protein 3-like isoform X2 [Homarus americanus]
MAGIISIVLERDGHDQPWGFRLQGGVDVAMPLSVQRVLVGTPSEGVLLKGDIITKISCTETKNITHQQAADLFNNAGNQIAVQIKRAGVQPTPAAASTAAPLVNGSPVQPPVSVPVSGGVPLPGITSNTTARPENPAVRSLPKTQFVLKSDLPRPQKQPTNNMETLSIQSQPYRTLPLVQPSAKVRADLGVGSISHLKMQDDHISGVKEPQFVPQSQAVAAKAKHDEIIMKQKTQQSLTTATQASNPTLVTKQYNSPLPLYSQENVQEAMRMQTSPSHTPTINPVASSAAADAAKALRKVSSPTPANKPVQVILTPSKEYNPQSSATWRALQETDAPIDPEKVANYSALKEHDPIYSEVYTAPVAPKPGQRPPARTNALPGPRSPVSELLPPPMRPANEVMADSETRSFLSPPKTGPSAVLSAALAESKPVDQMTTDRVKIPIYEDDYALLQETYNPPRRPGGPKTNAIGGRKKIAQTAFFNKLMMDVLGE